MRVCVCVCKTHRKHQQKPRNLLKKILAKMVYNIPLLSRNAVPISPRTAYLPFVNIYTHNHTCNTSLDCLCTTAVLLFSSLFLSIGCFFPSWFSLPFFARFDYPSVDMYFTTLRCTVFCCMEYGFG